MNLFGRMRRRRISNENEKCDSWNWRKRHFEFSFVSFFVE